MAVPKQFLCALWVVLLYRPFEQGGCGPELHFTLQRAVDYALAHSRELQSEEILLKNAESNNLPEELRFGDWRKLDEEKIERILRWLWKDQACRLTTKLATHIMGARKRLEILTNV